MMFQTELKFFQEHQSELVHQYAGKVLVIQGSTLLGVYENLVDAFKETTKTHALGSFMLQRCIPGPDAYTVTISSLGIIGAGA